MIPAAIGQGCGGCTEPDPGPIAADIAYSHRRPEINNRARVLQLTRLRQAKGSQPLGLSIAAMPAAIPADPRLLTIGHRMYRREMECRDWKYCGTAGFPAMARQYRMPTVNRRLSGEPKQRRCRQLPGGI